MRHIELVPLLRQIFLSTDGQEAKVRLGRAHLRSVRISAGDRYAYAVRNGPNKWRPIKDLITSVVGKKCWYTEYDLSGAALVVDHYRPIRDYWWLTYDVENYRIACPWANSSEHNALHGRSGGKGKEFPLLAPGLRAKGKKKLRVEKPVILDPCNAADCALLAFQADGRPVLHPNFAGDPTARRRVEESKILLNLDHPDFNSKREQLCNEIALAVRTHEALPAVAAEKAAIRNALGDKIASDANFSTAARFYLQLHRHLDWVETLLNRD
jgi:hypothetical protein